MLNHVGNSQTQVWWSCHQPVCIHSSSSDTCMRILKNSALWSFVYLSNIFICHVQNPDASDTQCAHIYMYEKDTESSNAGYVLLSGASERHMHWAPYNTGLTNLLLSHFSDSKKTTTIYRVYEKKKSPIYLEIVQNKNNHLQSFSVPCI